jgi:hypothetical protein
VDERLHPCFREERCHVAGENRRQNDQDRWSHRATLAAFAAAFN